MGEHPLSLVYPETVRPGFRGAGLICCVTQKGLLVCSGFFPFPSLCHTPHPSQADPSCPPPLSAGRGLWLFRHLLPLLRWLLPKTSTPLWPWLLLCLRSLSPRPAEQASHELSVKPRRASCQLLLLQACVPNAQLPSSCILCAPASSTPLTSPSALRLGGVWISFLNPPRRPPGPRPPPGPGWCSLWHQHRPEYSAVTFPESVLGDLLALGTDHSATGQKSHLIALASTPTSIIWGQGQG